MTGRFKHSEEEAQLDMVGEKKEEDPSCRISVEVSIEAEKIFQRRSFLNSE